eukprot:m.338977 g.338977  ORF g.338977 m.338977 type:complete len:1351 (-) comp16089_c0_seq6:1694-5746(-)
MVVHKIMPTPWHAKHRPLLVSIAAVVVLSLSWTCDVTEAQVDQCPILAFNTTSEAQSRCWGVPARLCGTEAFPGCTFFAVTPGCIAQEDADILPSVVPCENAMSYPACEFLELYNRACVWDFGANHCDYAQPPSYKYLTLPLQDLVQSDATGLSVRSNIDIGSEFKGEYYRVSSDSVELTPTMSFITLKEWNYFRVWHPSNPNQPATVFAENFTLSVFVQPAMSQPVDTPSLDTPSTLYASQRWLLAPPLDLSTIPDGSAAVAISMGKSSIAVYEVISNGTFYCIAVVEDVPTFLGRLLIGAQDNRIMISSVARTIDYGLCSGRRLLLMPHQFGLWTTDDSGFVGRLSFLNMRNSPPTQDLVDTASEMWERGVCSLSYEQSSYDVTSNHTFTTSAAAITSVNLEENFESASFSFIGSVPDTLSIDPISGAITGTLPYNPLDPHQEVSVQVTTDPITSCREIVNVGFQVFPPLMLHLNVSALPSMTITHPFTARLSTFLNVTGGVAPYTVTLTGELPGGIRFERDPVDPLNSHLSGVPTYGVEDEPVLCFTDSVGASTCRNLSLVVFAQLTVDGCASFVTAATQARLPPPSLTGGATLNVSDGENATRTVRLLYSISETEFSNYTLDEEGNLWLTIGAGEVGGQVKVYRPVLHAQDINGAQQAVRLKITAYPMLTTKVHHYVSANDFEGIDLEEPVGTVYEFLFGVTEGVPIHFPMPLDVEGGRGPYTYRLSPDNIGLQMGDGLNVTGVPVLPPGATAPFSVDLFITAIDANQAETTVLVGQVNIDAAKNTVAIVIGVCVAVMVLGILITVLVFWFKNKKEKEIDQEQDDSHLTKAEKLENFVRNRVPVEFREQILSINQTAITMHGKLGDGHFGSVYHAALLVEDKTSCGDRAVAVKRQKFQIGQEESQQEEVADEVGILVSLRGCAYIIRVQGFIATRDVEDNAWTITELCYGGDLSNYLLSCTELCMHRVLLLLNQVATGLAWMHSKGYVHRDIAARNILLLADKKHAKIGDFGLACKIKDCMTSKLSIPLYSSSPELLAAKMNAKFQQTQAELSDVWSFGVLMWECITLGVTPEKYLCPPFYRATSELYNALTTSTIFSVPYFEQDFPSIYKLMRSCTHARCSSRPSANRIKEQTNSMISQLCSKDKRAPYNVFLFGTNTPIYPQSANHPHPGDPFRQPSLRGAYNNPSTSPSTLTSSRPSTTSAMGSMSNGVKRSQSIYSNAKPAYHNAIVVNGTEGRAATMVNGTVASGGGGHRTIDTGRGGSFDFSAVHSSQQQHRQPVQGEGVLGDLGDAREARGTVYAQVMSEDQEHRSHPNVLQSTAVAPPADIAIQEIEIGGIGLQQSSV